VASSAGTYSVATGVSGAGERAGAEEGDARDVEAGEGRVDAPAGDAASSCSPRASERDTVGVVAGGGEGAGHEHAPGHRVVDAIRLGTVRVPEEHPWTAAIIELAHLVHLLSEAEAVEDA